MSHSHFSPNPAPFSLQGHVALVTGSSTGLGRALALALGQAGAKVVMNYSHNTERAQASFSEFTQLGGQGVLLQADVTQPEEVDRLIRQARETVGPVDILVLNATGLQTQKPVEEYEWAEFQAMLDFFIKSPFLLTRACLPEMKQNRWGRIINIGSEVVQRGVPNFSAYVAAKAGQNGLHRSLATELAPSGITVNMICPGWIPVERHDGVPQQDKDAYLSLVPAGRWGVPADLGGAVVFLASEAASFITGQSISINGGMTLA